MLYNRSLSATVYIIDGDRVLLHKHIKYNTWFPVGGHVEADEFPYEAALREVKEETGYDIKLIKTEVAPDFDPAPVLRIPMPWCTLQVGRDEKFYDFIFLAKITGGSLSPAEGESHDFRWFTAEELKTADEVKPHIKATALNALEFLKNKTDACFIG